MNINILLHNILSGMILKNIQLIFINVIAILVKYYKIIAITSKYKLILK